MTTGGAKVEEETVGSGGEGYGDYQITVRNFFSPDKPHVPLPYTLIVSEITLPTILHDGMVNLYNIDANLAGKYFLYCELLLQSSTPFFLKQEYGVVFHFSEAGYGGLWVDISINSDWRQPVFDGTNYKLSYTYESNYPVLIDINPKVSFYNKSGISIGGSKFRVYALDVDT